MPLSEEELRLLEQMERALVESDLDTVGALKQWKTSGKAPDTIIHSAPRFASPCRIARNVRIIRAERTSSQAQALVTACFAGLSDTGQGGPSLNFAA